jgi:hypothetical protein
MKSPRLLHFWLLLGLLAALAATPLRQVEAACDQARMLAERDGDVSIETEDGGVADDSDAATLGERAPRVDSLVLLGLWSLTASNFWDSQREARIVSPIVRPPRDPESVRERLARIPRFLI